MPTIFDRLQELVVWTQIRNLHNLRVVQQMYLWLILVPVIASTLSKVPNEVTFEVFGQPITFALLLPFSWKLFYFSAICFVASNLIYQAFCPRMIKNHPSYASFVAEGKGQSHLDWYNAMIGDPVRIPWQTLEITQEDSAVQEVFWKVHAFSNITYLPFRILAALLLAAGMAMVSFVVVQGFWSVVLMALR
jgi:hypothetical protein